MPGLGPASEHQRARRVEHARNDEDAFLILSFCLHRSNLLSGKCLHATHSRCSGGRFEKVRHPIVLGRDAVLMKNLRAGVPLVKTNSTDWSKSLSGKLPTQDAYQSSTSLTLLKSDWRSGISSDRGAAARFGLLLEDATGFDEAALGVSPRAHAARWYQLFSSICASLRGPRRSSSPDTHTPIRSRMGRIRRAHSPIGARRRGISELSDNRAAQTRIR